MEIDLVAKKGWVVATRGRGLIKGEGLVAMKTWVLSWQ